MTIVQPQLRLPTWADPQRWEENQQPIYEEILDRFNDGHKLVLADVPAGGGKSLLAWMVRQALDVSGYYLTGTKNLQRQVARDFPVAVLMGRANYSPYDNDDDDDDDDRSGRTWAEPNCGDCDKANTKLCSVCPDVDTCPYIVAKELAIESDLACSNYSYAFGEWSGRQSAFRDRGLVVCDEADTLTEELLRYVSVSISPRMQSRLHLKPPKRKTVESSWAEWFDYAIPHVTKQASFVKGKSIEQRRLRSTLDRLLTRMNDVATDLDGWVYDGYAGGAIEFKPVYVDKVAKDVLWSNGERFLCMSASLGSPEVFVQDHGWDDSYGYVQAPSTFDVARRPFYFFPAARMTHKEKETAWPQMARALRCTLTDIYPDLTTLVHAHSGDLTEYLAMELMDCTDRTVFYYRGSGEKKDAAIESFESTPGSVLVAPSLDRGYDNSSIQLNIIAKVPFGYQGSKQVTKRLRGKGGELWYANDAARSISQIYGRGMRHEKDEGTTVIFDSMFSKFYGDWSKPTKRDEHGNETREHYLFPQWVVDAVQFDSEFSFSLRQALKRVATV